MAKVRFEEIVIAVVSAVLGGFLGWGIERLVGAAGDLNAWFFVLTASACLVTCLVVFLFVPSMASFSATKHAEMTRLAQETKAIVEDALKHKAELIPRETVYPEMAKCLRNAKSQVAVVTYFMYDWERDLRTFLPPEQELVGQEDFYEAVYECIESPGVEYIRIWQVPEERRDQALKVIERNPLHKKEIALIRKISLKHPERARLVVAGEHTTASFILVDRRHLFFNVDFYDRARNVWLSPYMFLVKDATEGAFAGLNSIIVRLTNRMLDA